MSNGPSGVVVCGNNQQQVFFFDSSDGTLYGTQSFLYGQLDAPPVIRNLVVYCGEGQTFGTSMLHAFDLSNPANIVDWSTPPTIAGSIDAPVVLSGNTLYAASSTGFLDAFDISGDAPVSLPQVNVLQLASGDTATVNGLLLSLDSSQLFLTSTEGVYAVTIAAATPFVSWIGTPYDDFTALPPVLDGTMLIAVSESTLYGYDTSAVSGTSNGPDWTLALNNTPTALWPFGQQRVLVADSGGNFTIVSTPAGSSLGTVNVSLPAGATTQLAFSENLIVAASSSGALTAYTIDVSSAGAVTMTQSWTVTAPVALQGTPMIVGESVYVTGTDQNLYAYQINASAAIFVQSTGASGSTFLTSGFTPFVPEGTTGQVQFLLDGQTYFLTLRNLLIAAINGTTSPPASLPSSMQFDSLIIAVGQAGNDAYVMMWDTTIPYHMTEDNNTWVKRFQIVLTTLIGNLFTPGGAIRGDHRLSAQTYLALQGQQNVQAYLEPYTLSAQYWYELISPNYIEIGSNHQKIGIFSIAGVKYALVSGLNTINPSYWDTTIHPMTDASGNYDGASWHDAGLLLQGNVVSLIEAEFDRRWSKQNGSPPAPSGSTYVKFANFMISRTSCLDTPTVCTSGTTPTPYQNPTLSSPTVNLQVLLTNNEQWDPALSAPPSVWLGPTTEIRDALVQAIGAASSYMYFENYTFSDVNLVQAAAQAIAASSTLQTIIVVPHPTVGEFNNTGFTMEGGQYFLGRIAYAILKLASADWTGFWWLDQFFPRSSITSLNPNFDVRGLEYATITFATASSTQTVTATQISAIVEGSGTPQVMFGSAARYFATPPSDSSNALFSYPANFRRIYTHAKLALFDDEVALVGSANFSRRSMMADGELSVMVSDPTTALSIRTALFNHWNMTTPAAWNASMTSFAATTTPALGILPIAFSSMPTMPPSWAWSALNVLFDPSALL